MGTIKIHAGDFQAGDRHYWLTDSLALKTKGGETAHISGKAIEQLEVASEDSVKKLGGTLGWGAAGALALGPAGLLAGLLLGGKRTEVTFVAKLADGRKMLATTDAKTFTSMQAIRFR